MASITIRDVPDETRDALAARAAATGRSLQEYLRLQLIGLAQQLDPEEWVARVRQRVMATGTRLTADDIVSFRDADRR